MAQPPSIITPARLAAMTEYFAHEVELKSAMWFRAPEREKEK
ncbi:hypothetical protein ACT4WD_06865 [Acinetobacter baumannii]